MKNWKNGRSLISSNIFPVVKQPRPGSSSFDARRSEMISGHDTLRLELLSSAEIADAIDDGVRTVILPCGAVEQHGAHLPLSVDADHADYLGILLAQRLEKTLVAPTIRVGCSSHHLEFPGTISLRDETFEMIVQNNCTKIGKATGREKEVK